MEISNVELQRTKCVLLFKSVVPCVQIRQRCRLLYRRTFKHAQGKGSLPLYFATAFSFVAIPVYSACPAEVEGPTETQHDIVQVIRDNHLSEAEISALRETNYLRREQQEKALLEILRYSQGMTTTKIVAFAKVAPALVIPFISELEEFEQQCKLVDDLIGYWVSVDIATAINLIRELHAATLNDLLLRKSVKVLATVHPVEAFRFSHEYLGRFGYVLETIAFETMAKHQPRLAIEFIPEIRRKFHSVTTYSGDLSITNPLFKLDPSYAVEYGRSLNNEATEGRLSEAEEYFWELIDNFCDADPSVFINLKERIPAGHPLPHIADCVLTDASNKRYLTVEEFESLYKELSVEDQVAIDEFPRSRFVGDSTN